MNSITLRAPAEEADTPCTAVLRHTGKLRAAKRRKLRCQRLRRQQR